MRHCIACPSAKGEPLETSKFIDTNRKSFRNHNSEAIGGIRPAISGAEIHPHSYQKIHLAWLIPSPAGRCHAGPALECADEGPGLGISQQFGYLGDIL